jgi:hypothetical protein
MLFLTRWFGVTASDAERHSAREQSDIKEISERVLLMQANAAAQQHRPLGRGTHAKGVCAQAEFEIFDLTVGNDPKLAKRLAKGFSPVPAFIPPRFGSGTPIRRLTLISSPTSDHYLFRSISLGAARLFPTPPVSDKISHCKTRQLYPSTTRQLFWL